MQLSVRHVTRYTYTDPVSIAHNRACLHPRATPNQVVLSAQLTVAPAPAVMRKRSDYFGNQVTFFTVQESLQQFVVTAECQVDVTAPNPPAPALTPPFELAGAALRVQSDPAAFDANQFRFPSPLLPENDGVRQYAAKSFRPGRPVLEALIDLNSRIHQDFVFDPSATDVTTPLAAILRQRRGVCQDFAHLFVASARSAGLAARYVSGYILTTPPPGVPRLVGADASHAWASVWCGPEVGWIDLDPTNDKLVADEHVTVAWGRDYGDVSPLKGVILGGGSQSVSVAVDVVPVAESSAGNGYAKAAGSNSSR